MWLLLALLAGLGLWYWLRKRRRTMPAAWLGFGGALVGAALVAKGMPVVGTLVATASGLWLQYGGTLLGKTPTQPAPRPSRLSASRVEAAELLGVAPDADRETILAAHKRLMLKNHPDAGGSAGLAARINAARDLLLERQDN